MSDQCGISMSCDPRAKYDPGVIQCELPASNDLDAAEFLQVVATGGALGTGHGLNKVGIDMPRIRADYEAAIRSFMQEFDAKKASGISSKELADWAVKRRASIARQIRLKNSLGQTVLFEVRDNLKYGLGGRTPENLRNRYSTPRNGQPGLSGSQLDDALIKGATKPNQVISDSAFKAAKYLKHGGRVIVVVSVATTAYTLLTAPQEDLERILYEEAGGMVGGSLGASAAVGACLVFGIATGGWGLLACGVVGGLGGGALGTYAGNKIYYSTDDRPVNQANQTGVVQLESLQNQMVCE